MIRSLKKQILCLLVIAGLSFLWACSYRPEPAKDTEGKILFRLGFSGTPESLNPYTATDTEAEAVFALIYDTLFAVDPATGEVVPSLCREYSVRDSAAGGKLWHITLPENVRWHDGEPLTASDVEFTLQSLKELSALYGYPWCEMLDVTGIAVEDDTHLAMIVWGEEAEVLPCLARIPILPRHIWNEASYMDYGSAGTCADIHEALSQIGNTPVNSGTMVGSGLYTWDHYSDGVCSLRLNASYWNGTARAECLELRFGLDDTAAALKSGEIDACWDMSMRSWQELSQDKSVRVTAGTGGELYMLSFNHENNAALRDARVRRAIDLCINRQAILLMSFGGGFAERGMISPFSPWHYTSGLTYDRGYNPTEAANALETAGYKDADGDHYREQPNGTPLMLTLVYSTADPGWNTAAELIRSSCGQAGIDLYLRPMSPPAMEEAVSEGKYDILLTAVDTKPEPWQSLRSFYWNNGDNDLRLYDSSARFISRGWNLSGYANQDYDAVYEKLVGAEEDETRKALVLKAGQMLYDDAAAVPIGFHVRCQAHSSVWYSLSAGKTDGLFFTPETLSVQIQNMNCP